MSDYVLRLTPEAEVRLKTLAAKLEKPLDECLRMAVDEFIGTWEDYFVTVSALDLAEERPVLRVINY